MSDNNTIPVMTHPLSSGWRQPSTDKIILDAEYAGMEQSTFDQLLNYETTNPSGCYEGKMWRRGDKFCFWITAPNPNYCRCVTKKIIIL